MHRQRRASPPRRRAAGCRARPAYSAMLPVLRARARRSVRRRTGVGDASAPSAPAAASLRRRTSAAPAAATAPRAPLRRAPRRPDPARPGTPRRASIDDREDRHRRVQREVGVPDQFGRGHTSQRPLLSSVRSPASTAPSPGSEVRARPPMVTSVREGSSAGRTRTKMRRRRTSSEAIEPEDRRDRRDQGQLLARVDPGREAGEPVDLVEGDRPAAVGQLEGLPRLQPDQQRRPVGLGQLGEVGRCRGCRPTAAGRAGRGRPPTPTAPARGCGRPGRSRRARSRTSARRSAGRTR